MRIGVPKEIKVDEFRVAMTPAGVRELVQRGHEVLVEAGAGDASSYPDEAYRRAGARLVGSAEELWSASELVVKVKEPVGKELSLLRRDLVLFCYLHLAANRETALALVESGASAIAYETVVGPDGSLPLLAPMSEIAGRMAPQVAARFLEREAGGKGMLLGGLAGVRPATFLVLGAGVAGTNAAQIALGMGAQVVLLDRDVSKLAAAEKGLGRGVVTLAATTEAIEEAVRGADVVVGAVLVPGAQAPKLVSNALVAEMAPGSVLVDISVDQGGCFEASRPSTHEDPVVRVAGCLIYCVANMPGALPLTATRALTNSTLSYIEAIAEAGWKAAVQRDAGLRAGLNVTEGRVVHPAVAEALGVAPEDPWV